VKVFCCICQSNQLVREIQHTSGGGKLGASQKTVGPWLTQVSPWNLHWLSAQVVYSLN